MESSCRACRGCPPVCLWNTLAEILINPNQNQMCVCERERWKVIKNKTRKRKWTSLKYYPTQLPADLKQMTQACFCLTRSTRLISTHYFFVYTGFLTASRLIMIKVNENCKSSMILLLCCNSEPVCQHMTYWSLYEY